MARVTKAQAKRLEAERIERAKELLATLKTPERFARFAGIISPERVAEANVNIIGCGGIGSWVAMGLACMGVRAVVFDPDKTEAHNFGGQPLPEVGAAKVDQIVKYIGPMAEGILGVQARFDLGQAKKHPALLWVSGVDSVESRVEIWEAIKTVRGKESEAWPLWYVDGRMGGTNSHVLTVDLKDEKALARYEKSLAPANGFTEDGCAMRSTVFAGMGCAAEVVSEVARILKGGAVSRQKNTEWLMYQHIEGWTT